MAGDNIETETPQWLSQKYLEKALQKYKKDETLRIITLEKRPAVPKGENYASVMTRVLITFEYGTVAKIKQQVSYIVKSAHESDPRIMAICMPYQTFKIEMDMYEIVLPNLAALLQKTGHQEKLFPETIHVDYSNEAIIFEDLSVSNFRVADRIAGMNLADAKLALRKLAKMHAAGAVLNERTNGSLMKFNRGIFNRFTRGFGSVFENILGVCAEFAGDCPELGAYYKEKLLKLIPHVVDYGISAAEPKADQFQTLTHGDFWINNMMLRYDDMKSNGEKQTQFNHRLRNAKDIVLIDFQFCKWTSPAVDLHYFFNTSLESHLRLNSQDELVQYYHGILRQTLRELEFGGRIPSLHEFCVQVEDRRFYALTSSLVSQAIMINDKTEDSDIQALVFDDERGRNFRKMLYKNPVVQENAKTLLPFFDKRGLLDVVN